MKLCIGACVFTGLLWAIAPVGAAACGTCAVGDPAVAAFGEGAPRPRRLRVALALRLRGFDVRALPPREGLQVRVEERRLALRMAYALNGRFALTTQLFGAHQTLSMQNGARLRRYVLGDATVGGRYVLYRDRALGPDHLLSVALSSSLPIGSHESDGRIGDLAPDANLAASGVQLRSTLAYRYRRRAWTLDAQAGTRLGAEEEMLLANVRATYAASPFLSVDAGTTAQYAIGGLRRDALYGTFGFWLRLGPSLLGAHAAVPLAQRDAHSRDGAVLTLDWVSEG